MKSAILSLTVAVALCLLSACNRQAPNDPRADATPVQATNTAITKSNARQVGADYSQPISLDTANKMISSYLQSVNYPNVDTAVRSLAFSADTLRAYLSDARITSLEFVLAHQLSYLNGGSNRFGKNIGMKPGALTIIAVGMDDNGNVVRNSSNGVYEHAMPCPNFCPNVTDAFLH
jgi:predicted small lipoprotein YifL